MRGNAAEYMRNKIAPDQPKGTIEEGAWKTSAPPLIAAFCRNGGQANKKRSKNRLQIVQKSMTAQKLRKSLTLTRTQKKQPFKSS